MCKLITIIVLASFLFSFAFASSFSLQKAPMHAQTGQSRQRKFEGRVSGKPSAIAFVLRTASGRVRIDASRAKIAIDGAPSELSGLRDGMVVVAWGKMVGAMLMASRVEAKRPQHR